MPEARCLHAASLPGGWQLPVPAWFPPKSPTVFGLLLVLEPHHGSGDVHALVSYLARDLTVISACCIEQQQGVPGLGSAGAGKLLLNALD